MTMTRMMKVLIHFDSIEIEEIWKDIRGYEGRYQISNKGRVKSLERFIKPTGPFQKTKTCREKILKTSIAGQGYRHVSLENKKHLIHRLLAEAFIPNELKYKCVNHKDGNKLNNDLDNLEWCTYKHNTNHAFDTGLVPTNIRIRVTILKTGEVKEFRSKAMARKILRMSERRLNKGLESGILQGMKLETF